MGEVQNLEKLEISGEIKKVYNIELISLIKNELEKINKNTVGDNLSNKLEDIKQKREAFKEMNDKLKSSNSRRDKDFPELENLKIKLDELFKIYESPQEIMSNLKEQIEDLKNSELKIKKALEEQVKILKDKNDKDESFLISEREDAISDLITYTENDKKFNILTPTETQDSDLSTIDFSNENNFSNENFKSKILKQKSFIENLKKSQIDEQKQKEFVEKLKEENSTIIEQNDKYSKLIDEKIKFLKEMEDDLDKIIQPNASNILNP